jgi:imidazolonepropionase-like amidohydrolase
MRPFSPLLPLLALALATPLPAQQIPPPPPPSSPTPRGEPGVTDIHAGTLLDRPGRAPRRNASILIRDGRIVSVEDGFMAAPEGARVIDLRDRFVLPGLIDSHVHLDSDRAGVEGLVAGFTDSVALRAHEAGMNARRTLDAGFTTVRNLGSSDGVTLGLRDAIVRGWAIGPRIVDAGTSISTTSGHMDDTLGVREDFHEILRSSGSTCDGPDDCRRAVRRQIARGVDVIKIATTGGVNSRIGLGLGAQMTEEEARAIVETARLYGRRVAVHAHGTDGINLALRVGANSSTAPCSTTRASACSASPALTTSPPSRP